MSGTTLVLRYRPVHIHLRLWSFDDILDSGPMIRSMFKSTHRFRCFVRQAIMGPSSQHLTGNTGVVEL